MPTTGNSQNARKSELRVVKGSSKGPHISGVSEGADEPHSDASDKGKDAEKGVVALVHEIELDPHGVNELSQWVDEIKSYWSSKFDALEAELRKPAGKSRKR